MPEQVEGTIADLGSEDVQPDVLLESLERNSLLSLLPAAGDGASYSTESVAPVRSGETTGSGPSTVNSDLRLGLAGAISTSLADSQATSYPWGGYATIGTPVSKPAMETILASPGLASGSAARLRWMTRGNSVSIMLPFVPGRDGRRYPP